MRIFFATCIALCFLFTCFKSFSQPSVSTQHNDLGRTGWNAQESQLKTTNVKSGSFGKLFTRTVDDQLYAQPLVVLHVNIPSIGQKNVVFLATVNNSIYAFDADSSSIQNPYWQNNLTPAGSRPPKAQDMTGACGGGYRDFSANMGIVGTPVIDTLTQTMFVVARSVTNNGNSYSQYLHALDITTGLERTGSPVMIAAQADGNGDGSVNGKVSFEPQKNNQRPGLLLLNDVVYIGFSSHCDWQPYHGWLLGYDAHTLRQKIVYCVSPDGYEGGIWMSGSAPSADALGNIYISTGNGTIGKNGVPTDPSNRGESAVKLAVSGNTLSVQSYFTPSNYAQLEAGDLDFGVAEMLLIPNSNLVLTGCKDGHLYLMDRNNMGSYSTQSNNVVQTIDLGPNAHLRSSFSYYAGATNEFVYEWAENTLLKAFKVNRNAGNLNATQPISGPAGPIGNNGAFMSVSSNGSADSTAILWVSHAANGDANQSVRPGILRAFAANDVTHELWNSEMDVNDNPGNYAKFVCPTVTNGKVYLATFSNQLVVYGLTGKVADTCNSQNLALGKTATASSLENATLTAASAVDGDENTRWSSAYSDPQYISVDLGKRYDICRVVIHWETAFGQDYQIQLSDDGQNWNTITNIVGNVSLTNVLNVNGAGRYVRMYGTKRGTQYGYSIYEFQVFGAVGAICPPPTNISVASVTDTSAIASWTSNSADTFALHYKTIDAACWTTVMTNSNSYPFSNLVCGTNYIFQVATMCGTDTGSYSNNITFTTLPCHDTCGILPTRWTSSDIGCVNIPGSACYSDPTFTLKGSGADLGGTYDEGRAAYKTRVGDGEIIARITSLNNADQYTKSGLTMREDVSGGARNVFVGIAGSNTIVMQYRQTANGNTTSITDTTTQLPYWLKLTRTGTVFSAYRSSNGVSWKQVGGSVDLGFNNSTPVDAGMIVSSHDNANLSTATFDNYSESLSPLQIQLDDFSAKITPSHTVLLTWTTSDELNVGNFVITRKNDYQGFKDIGTVAPHNSGNAKHTYQFEDSTPFDGINYYRLKIEDLGGQYTYSAIVMIRFTNDDAPLLFPNPVTDVLTIAPGVDPIVSIRLINMSGQQLLHFEQNTNANVTLPLSNVSRGVYIIETKTNRNTYRTKIIKL